MIGHLATRVIRRHLIGRQQEFAFQATRELRLPCLTETDFYLHIPFCKSLCPYCPYNRIVYQEDLVGPYTDAMLAEIDMYGEQLGKVKLTSIYIGGGTPTTLINELGAILGRIREKFEVSGPVCIEANPGDVTPFIMRKLQDCGVNMISIGVQSFSERSLRLIGRQYDPQDITRAIELAVGAGLDSVNLDLMFALPGQSLRDLEADLMKAIASGANQITTYPLFTFPYTSVGRFLKLKQVKMPNLVTRRVMYRFIHRFCEEQGFRRISVWGFLRGTARRYSSVTRDLYLGFGAGAGSHVPGGFYLNTFSVPSYIESCSQGRPPIGLHMTFSPAMSQFFWLYWRLYDTYIPKQELREVFSDRESARKAKQLLALIRCLRLGDETERGYKLNERGAFWLHLVQNHFALNYVNTIWTAAKSRPFPEVIRF